MARGRPLHHRRPADGHRPTQPQTHRHGRRIPQPRRLCEARRGAAGVPACAQRSAGRFRGQPTSTRRSSSMTYFEGFIVPVPEANKDAYRQHAREFAPLIKEFGVSRYFEAWESDVPEGKVTDFRKAVDARPDEKIVFAFFEYPD